MRWLFTLLILATALGGLAKADLPDLPSATAPADSGAVEQLIAALNSPDPDRRERAASALVTMGEQARPAVLAATHSANPNVRQQASDVLMQMPWIESGDTPVIQQALLNYGTLSDEQRAGEVEQIGHLHDKPSLNALLRLMREDPSEQVRWEIFRLFYISPDRIAGTDPAALEKETDSPAGIALRGLVVWRHDHAAGAALMEKALTLAAQHPVEDGGQTDTIYEWLTRMKIDAGDITGARATLLQQLQSADPADPEPPAALFTLLNLQAHHGPLPGLSDDLQAARKYAGDARMMYLLGRIYARNGCAPAAILLTQTAFTASLNDPARHMQVGGFLYEHDWLELAEVEFQAVLALDQGTEEGKRRDNTVHLGLALVAEARKDSVKAGDEYLAAVSCALPGTEYGRSLGGYGEDGEQFPITQDELASEAHWHYFEAAKTKGDTETMKKELDWLIHAPDVIDMVVLDLIPYLREQHREQDAQAVFDAAYARAKQLVQEHPNNPAYLNGLAWLCSQSHEHIDEAVDCSAKALELSPTDPAFLDTAADARFEKGDQAAAIALETQALDGDPDDKVMIQQLARFKAGKK